MGYSCTTSSEVIEIKEVIKEIIKGLGNIYPVNTIKRKPEYPYLTYNILVARTDDNFTGVMTTELDGEMVRYKHSTQPSFVLSINAYSNSQMEALDEIERAWDYFKHVGYDDLSRVGGVVVEQTDISDRTVMIVDDYEYRFGFDVRIRVRRDIIRRDYYVENIDLDMEEIR